MGKNKYIESPERTSYVYAHIRADKREPFYIGIGRRIGYKRSFEMKGRNSIWNKIACKTKWVSTILYSGLSWREACEIEISLISHIGRLDKGMGTLANLTDGGDGNLGTKFTEERKKKISEALTGKKLSKERVDKMRLRRHTDESRQKIRDQKTGLKASEYTRSKMRLSNMGLSNPSAEILRKPLIDLNTGVYYTSVRDAAKVYGITHGYLSGMLLGRYKNKTSLRYA